MKTSINKLAESILDLRIIDKNELESMIEVYFKIWQEEQLKNLIYKNDPVLALRNEISKQKQELHIKKEQMQRQIDRANIAIEQGKKINLDWLSSLKSALRNVKYESHRLQERKSEVKYLEKMQNIKTSADRRNIFHAHLSDLLEEIMSKEEKIKIFEEAGRRADEYIENSNICKNII